ncbi:alternative ribosome rescue aminoacyl-tRNA hydrolase ArfB [Pedobacter sp. SYP-B3415]|uniref:alternative ribosome rescue aminoacyl-tRNA hydrolase ArfB n=1 Tax=Pedobacter sp. SYP-B3415 TaxID=2496641 RepID=UPI00101CFA76|nr:alternative ribosome rescue aminoacyl-tRNA hydrolase ArfB [Pedobacter sp. SYP-B3415]
MEQVPEAILQEIQFKTSRSSGSGGQHVNKVSTKVELIFNLEGSVALSATQKERLRLRLAHRLDKEGNLHVVSQESRSQLANKETAVEKFLNMISRALIVPATRKPTRIPKAVIARRLDYKKRTADKKSTRRKPSID